MATVASTEVAHRALSIPVETTTLDADLAMPASATGLVLFAHGSGSSRFSTRNRAVAKVLNDAGVATVLADLLTPEEEAIDDRTRQLRFDIPMLAERLVDVVAWLANESTTAALPIGLFGASTGAGAALLAAAHRPDLIRAVVSRGGRPDLAGDALAQVKAPTLLIVGGADTVVIGLNKQALAHLHGDAQLVIVPGATHLFEEAGALEMVAELARDWFLNHLNRQ
jgi:putative phosphoribosyl transferase